MRSRIYTKYKYLYRTTILDMKINVLLTNKLFITLYVNSAGLKIQCIYTLYPYLCLTFNEYHEYLNS